MNKIKTTTKICNILAAVFVVALLVMQFLPYWYAVPLNAVDAKYYTAEELAQLPAEEQEKATPVSMAKACWFPEEKQPVPVFIGGFMALSLCVLFFCLVKNSSTINFVWPMAASIVVLLGYLNGNAGTIAANGKTVLVPELTPEFLQGGNLWIVHVILAALIGAVSLVLAFIALRDIYSWVFGAPKQKKAPQDETAA